jgi:uncharacterized protein (TIGR02646 family)
MRFIEKINITEIASNHNLASLNNYIHDQLFAEPDPLHPSYNLERNIRQGLESQLLSEQKGLCCYCLMQLEDQDYHIEHLAPQSAFINEEVNYYNLYLSCGSHRYRKDHCGHQKENNLIPKVISYFNPNTNAKCEDFFKYNLLGEILPKDGLDTMTNNYRHFETLNQLTKSLISTIEVLNLNCEELVTIRRRILDGILALQDNQARLENMLMQVLTPNQQTGKLESLCELSAYIIRLKINQLNI